MSASSLNRSSAIRNIAVKKTLNSSGEGTHFWTKPLCHPKRLQAYAFFAIARESSRSIVSSYIVEVADSLLIIYHLSYSIISSIIHHLSSIIYHLRRFFEASKFLPKKCVVDRVIGLLQVDETQGQRCGGFPLQHAI